MLISSIKHAFYLLISYRRRQQLTSYYQAKKISRRTQALQVHLQDASYLEMIKKLFSDLFVQVFYLKPPSPFLRMSHKQMS